MKSNAARLAAPLKGLTTSCGGVRIWVCADLELYPKGRSPQFERVAEEMFQVPAIGVRDVAQRGAVDDDQRRVDAPLVRVAQLGRTSPERAGCWRSTASCRVRVRRGVDSLTMAAA